MINNFTVATDIYAYLNEHRSLTREKQSTLFDAYADEETQKLVKLIAERFKTKVMLINNTIYLIPNSDNKLLSYTKTELKEAMLRPGKYDEADFNLANFIIGELLTTFYNSKSEQLAMFQKSYSDFENRVNTSIKKAQEYNVEELENENNIPFINVIKKWNSLKGSDGEGKQKETRYGFMCKVLGFLDSEKLIEWFESDKLIKPTKKLNDLVTGVILYKPEFKKQEELFKKLKSQEPVIDEKRN